MRFRKHLVAILLTASLTQVLAISATATDTQPATPSACNSMASKDELSAQKELFQVQLDAKKELLQKDIDAQAKRIDAFEKRIDDQNSRIGDIGSGVDRLTSATGDLGILITVILVGIGIWGYTTARNDAKETAQVAASQWFKENNNKLISQMEELEKRASHASLTIDEHREQFVQDTNAARVEIEASKEKVQADIEALQTQLLKSNTVEKSEDLVSTETPDVRKSAEQLKQKPESEYTFTDWNTRAFAAYSEGKLEDAIFYWDKAISSPDIHPQAHAQTLFNKGYCLSKLNRSEEAIATYEALITKFEPATELALREPVAKAMFNKGITLDQLNRSEEAITSYDALITQFGTAKELALREQVAKAMLNKSIRLSKLNRSEAAIATFDALITQFEPATELALREQVAKAMNNKSFSLLCLAKASWENTDLANELLAKASDACKLAISKNADNGLAHGNLAYISWLQGDAVAAEQHFRTGLAATKNGGETLYNGTLKDFDIHPIEPDHGFRELVEKLWAEYQQAA